MFRIQSQFSVIDIQLTINVAQYLSRYLTVMWHGRIDSPVTRLFLQQLDQTKKNQSSLLVALCEGNLPLTCVFLLQSATVIE